VPVTGQTTPAWDGDIEESERTVMAVITVDGKDVEVGDKEQLNVIQAADRAGVPIPFYCWHPGLSVVASCRMCLVEVGSKNKDTGEVAMQPRLVPACQTPAKDGTVVVTNSAKVKANQNFVQEGLLLDHPIDCPICDQAGECWLQDYYFNYGHQQRRADVRPFNSRRKDLGEHVTLFVDRCVMCSRCVRFTREVSGEGELQVIQRGAHAEIDIFPDHPINNSLSGNVNDLCPVGALCSKDFLYNQRVWFMQAHNGVCTGCSAGCSVQRQVSENKLHRIQPRYNPNANDWWMCDIGRYENGHVHAPERIDGVMKRGADGKFEAVDWSVGLKEINDLLYDAVIQHGPRQVAFELSPFLSCEEAFLLAQYARKINAAVPLYLGKVPMADGDETFKAGFTIRAERAPNRLGVEAVIRHFQDGKVHTWTDLVSEIDAGTVRVAYVSGNAPSPWVSPEEAKVFAKLHKCVAHDMLPNDIARQAAYVVPGVSSAEKDGCYVNHAGLLQASEWAIRPVTGAHTDGQTFGDLLGRKGLYHAASVIREMADTISFFSRAKGGVPEAGLNLVTGTEIQPTTTELGTVTHPLPTFRSVASSLVEVERA
jgi:NADH-quinone oxidoreductase subunit G